MTSQHDRRGFLRGLVTLPLVGGGITLIGAPTGVAEPASDWLLQNYSTWIERERRRVAEVLGAGGAVQILYGPASDWFDQELATPPEEIRTRVATRAAVVLSAVGCDWRGDWRKPWLGS
ncbi:hypothetical protein [Methylobacterium isbiliense]|jgi:hypothetical protein|uniref:Uncharacterized protein n=1 Tax=Methylobacterium isbiliense TaxID=315478 RepID=A0ABQ4SCA5_9HYPH|nr:hypothetical protein [Methylobacterium isbiliense]MDN3625578.1 hypothetical protein [Methylobacterium isbiliense]GJE00013.1 hypothetical protein GMJLKIPL_1931 [Methylobacterium isbiliense]